LEQPLTFDELLFMLTEAFDAEPEVLRQDLQETLDLFAQSGLLATGTIGDEPAPS
jgi:hypothetical protein